MKESDFDRIYRDTFGPRPTQEPLADIARDINDLEMKLAARNLEYELVRTWDDRKSDMHAFVKQLDTLVKGFILFV